MRTHGKDSKAQPIDLTGQKFGWLTVLSYAGNNSRREAMWLCVCGCTEKKIVVGAMLRKKKVTSCGCRKRLRQSQRLRKAFCNGATPSRDLKPTQYVDPEWDA